MTSFEKFVFVSHLRSPKIRYKACDSLNLSSARRSLVTTKGLQRLVVVSSLNPNFLKKIFTTF